MLILAQVDPKLVSKGVDMAHENPVWVVVYVLVAIVAVILFPVVWYIRKGHPDLMAARAADRKERADRAEAERKARAEEKALDRQLLKDVATAAIAHAQDGARATVSEVTKEIGERVQDVHDQVSQANEITRRVDRNLLAIAAKLGVGLGIVGLLGFTPRSAGETERHDLGVPEQVKPVEVARVGSESGETPPPSRKLPPPGPPRRDCDATTCKAPAYCSSGQCVGNAKKKPPVKLASEPAKPSAAGEVMPWMDTNPDPMPGRVTDYQWLAAVSR